MHLQSLKLLCLTDKEELHLQENTLFDLDLGVMFTRIVTQYDLCTFEVGMSMGLGGDAFTMKYII